MVFQQDDLIQDNKVWIIYIIEQPISQLLFEDFFGGVDADLLALWP